MAKKNKAVVARNASDLAKILGLDAAEAAEMEFRTVLNAKIIKAVKEKGVTHVEVAKKAKTSRTRVTAILNGNTKGVSTDLMLRILYALGYKTKVTFAHVKLAA